MSKRCGTTVRRPDLRGILSHCVWPLHTSRLEGINNKIKVIKRIAYGFRDEEYFFLKIGSIHRYSPMNHAGIFSVPIIGSFHGTIATKYQPESLAA